MIRKSPNKNHIYVTFLILFSIVGLAVLGWQAGKEPLEPAWEIPTLAAKAQTATLTPTPGWWEQISPRPLVPTMPGRLEQSTPTPTPTTTEFPLP